MPLLDKHRTLLAEAVSALSTRSFWSPFPEIPSPRIYGDTAQTEGQAAVEALFQSDYPLDQPGETRRVITEQSPYGVTLGIRYPVCDAEALLKAAGEAEPSWQAAGLEGRIGVLLEALARIHKRSFEIAHAVMLTSGQGSMMAFQAGGPHAQDRALEAIAQAWKLMSEVPTVARWEKPQGKNPPIVMQKHFDVVGRGIALVIGCATFPTWNTYPGLFAALSTGNPVIVKPHPNAVLPAALTVSILREVLCEQGLDRNTVLLGVSDELEFTQQLATDRRIASIDFTGSDVFGAWLIEHARQARVYAEMAGVNTVIVESTDQYAGMLRNLAFSLCLYSGQMCTTPQNILLPRRGIATDEGHKSVDQFGDDLADAIDHLLADPRVAATVLGAIGSDATLARVADAALEGRIVHASEALEHPDFPKARVRTPLVLSVRQTDASIYARECFGPVTYLVETDSADASVQLAESVVGDRGALTLSVYSTNRAFIDTVTRMSRRSKVALSINLTQGVYVNQSAGFSDFHATGANPAATASYTNAAFLADRYVVVQRREHL